MTAASDSSTNRQPKYAARVPLSIQTPDVVETSRLGRLDFFDGMPSDETARWNRSLIRPGSRTIS